VSGFLLDTDVLSEIVRPQPDPEVVQWVESTDESLLYISVLTLGEIRKGLTPLPDGRRRASLESWLDHDLVVRFSDASCPSISQWRIDGGDSQEVRLRRGLHWRSSTACWPQPLCTTT